MMKELLEIYFGKHYQSPKSALVISDIKKGVFSLSDPKACADCKKYTPGKEVDCDRIVLCLNSDVHEVEVIQLEKFVDNYANLKAIPNGKKCDLLLVGNEKIVFCDMTCSKARYIDPYVMQDGTQKTGKRDTVKKQIANSISLLQNVPEIASEIDVKNQKIALFAYRTKDEMKSDAFDREVVSKMQLFGMTTDRHIKEPMFSDIGCGFLFTEIKYPEVYLW